MNRLSVRLVISHLLVAVLGGLATFLVVRLLTPVIFDRSVGMMGDGSMMGGNGNGFGNGNGGATGQGLQGALRTQVSDAVTQALVVGLLVGVVAAAVAGVFAASRVIRPVQRVSESARRIAAGHYDVHVEPPQEVELASLAEDVNTLGKALAETESRRTRLLGEVAHEMRTPLTVVDGYVEGMIDGVLPTTPAELGKVSDEVRRLRRLSEDLSALSRAEEGRLVLERVPTDLARLVLEATERLRAQAEDSGLRLRVDRPSGAVPVLVDPDRLAQVVTNLVGNAVRACATGGSIEVRVTADGGTATVEVADSGEGLAAEDLERVFERFYRVPGRRGESGGSGIGLTIARGIVAAHGGRLWAASPGRGQGATFTLTLPLAGAPGPASER